MDEDKGVPPMSMENEIPALRQKSAWGKQWKATISKKRSTHTPTTSAFKLLESNGDGTVIGGNSNVKRQKVLISKTKTSASCSQTTSKCTKASQEALEILESDRDINTKGTIFKSSSRVNDESSFPDPLNPQPSLNPSLGKNTESRNCGVGIMRHCEICGVYCSGAFCFHLHLRGKKHQVKQKLWQLNGDSSVDQTNKQLVRCDLCNISCQDKTLLELHLKGRKHTAKLHELEHGENADSQHFWCQLCQVPCTNKETFTLHLNGKKHIKLLQMS